MLRTLSLCALLLALPACEDPKESESSSPAAEPTRAEMQVRVDSRSAELSMLSARPWTDTLHARDGLNALQKTLVWHSMVLQREPINAVQAKTRIQEAAAFLSTLAESSSLPRLLEGLAPQLDALFSQGETARRLFETTRVPESAAFPLRDEWQTVQLEREDQAIRLIRQALAELSQDKNAPQKLKAGQAALVRAVQSSKELNQRLRQRLQRAEKLAPLLSKLESRALWTEDAISRIPAGEDTASSKLLSSYQQQFGEAWTAFQPLALEFIQGLALAREVPEGTEASLLAEAKRLMTLTPYATLVTAAQEIGIAIPRP